MYGLHILEVPFCVPAQISFKKWFSYFFLFLLLLPCSPSLISSSSSAPKFCPLLLEPCQSWCLQSIAFHKQGQRWLLVKCKLVLLRLPISDSLSDYKTSSLVPWQIIHYKCLHTYFCRNGAIWWSAKFRQIWVWIWFPSLTT